MKEWFKNFGGWLREYGGKEWLGRDRYPFAAFMLGVTFKFLPGPLNMGRIAVVRWWIPDFIQAWILDGFTEEAQAQKISALQPLYATIAIAGQIDAHGDIIDPDAMREAVKNYNENPHRPLTFAYRQEANPVGLVDELEMVGNEVIARVRVNAGHPTIKDLLQTAWVMRPAYKGLDVSMEDQRGMMVRVFSRVEIIEITILPENQGVSLLHPKLEKDSEK